MCLKLWRHEAARRYREKHSQEVRLLLFVWIFVSESGGAIPETHISSHSQICIAFAYIMVIDGTCSRVSTFSVISWGFSPLCVDNYVAEKACEKIVFL